MKTTIERAALLKTLGHVQSVVERRNTIPILSNVLLSAKDGRLNMTATDLDIQIVDSAEASVATEGTTTVQAQTLLDIVRKLPDGSQVQLEVDGGRMKVVSGRSRFQMPCLPSEDFPVIARNQAEHSFTVSTSSLQTALERTRFAMSTEETRYYLNGIYLHVVDGKLLAVATDGHRLARTQVDTGDAALAGMPDVIVPRKTVGELIKLLGEYDGDIEVGISRSKLAFDIGRLSLTSKTIDGTFPDYTRVIPQNNETSVRTDTKTLSSAVDRVTIIASEKTRAVKMKVDAGTITLTVNSPEHGTANDEVPCDSNGEVEVGFNARYLVETLKYVDSENVEIRFDTSASPVLITDLSRPYDVNVLMPMRV
jgi:DNA polymerase-3 subunit beta